MLDPNTCIAIIKRRLPQALKRFKAYKVGDIGMSWVTLAELEFGVAKSQCLDKNQAALDEFVLPLEIEFRSRSRQGLRTGSRAAGKKRHAHRFIGHDDRGACPGLGRNAGHQ
jgi:predicted nucleic acid-binding protein